MNQIAEATDISPPATGGGSGTGHFTGNLACSPFGQTGSLFQDTASVKSDPFSDLHAESRITDINVNDLERVEISSIQDEATNGRL